MAAIIVVDMQRDFMPGGAVPVPSGAALVPQINAVMDDAASRGLLVVATQDWHPPNHVSFYTTHADLAAGDKVAVRIDGEAPVLLFPPHCIAHTPGAALAAGLNANAIARVFRKGQRPDLESYSAFYDMARKEGTGLAEYLNSRGVRSVAVAGVATEFCVRATALDALSAGLQVVVLVDGVGAAEEAAGAAALAEVADRGGRLLRWEEYRAELEPALPLLSPVPGTVAAA